MPAGAEKEAADLRQKLEDRSAKLAKASQDLQALAQRAEVQTTACEHKVRWGLCSCRLTLLHAGAAGAGPSPSPAGTRSGLL